MFVSRSNDENPSPGAVESFNAADPFLNDVLSPLLYSSRQMVSGSERPVVAEGSQLTPSQGPPTTTLGPMDALLRGSKVNSQPDRV